MADNEEPAPQRTVRVIGAGQVHDICAWEALIAALADYHRGARPMVGRTSLAAGEGAARQTYIAMPAWLPGVALGSKLVTVFPDNPDRFPGVPAIQALYTLFDGRDGTPLAVIDATALTYRKTAADSALGSRLLSRPDAKVLAMIGAGGLAPYLVAAHRAVRPIERVLVWNRRMDKAEQLARDLNADGIAAAASDLESAVRQADIISCATAATTPLIDGGWLRPGSHLDLVGGFTREMRECDDGCVLRARLFVDSRWFALDTGDLADPMRRGVITHGEVEADLFDLCTGGGIARRHDDITLFKNAGGAHLDLFTALHIWSAARNASD